jgi:hypothetical protein
MSSEDGDVFETIKTLLQSGALSRGDLSPETLRFLDESENRGSTRSSARTKEQNSSAKSKSYRPLTETEIRSRLTRRDAEELLTFRQLVDIGVINHQDWDRLLERLLRSRLSVAPVFQSQATSSAQTVNVDGATSNSRALRIVGYLLGSLGVLAGLIVSFTSIIAGITIIANSLVFALVLVALGSYMEARLLQSQESLRRR